MFRNTLTVALFRVTICRGGWGEVSDLARFRVVSEHDIDEHQLRILEPAKTDWLVGVADRYRAIRTATQLTYADLTLDGITVLTTEALEERLRAATIAERSGGNFDVLRSDLAEVLMETISEETYGCLFGYRSLRDRELTSRPGRGIDQIAVEDPAVSTATGEPGKLRLVLGEAKLSSDTKSPPGVVDRGEDCLRSQHLMHMGRPAATADKVLHAARHATDRRAGSLLMMAAELLRTERFTNLEVICYSLMVRPQPLGSESDFGSFAREPGIFQPGIVRFLIVRLPGTNIDAIIDEFAILARGAATSEREESA